MSNRLGGFIAGQNINASIGTFTDVTSTTFTFASTQATPAVGQAVQLTTTGTLPTGLSTGTTYYVISTSTNTCQLSTTLGGSAVTFTNSSGSGTHTAVTQRAFNPYAGATDTVEYLVVAGGGSGALGAGWTGGTSAGAGAGGYLESITTFVPGASYTITVGAGGSAVTGTTYGNGNNGSNSSISGSGLTTITSTGGGGGGGYDGTNKPAGNGGSGGGLGQAGAAGLTGASAFGAGDGVGAVAGGEAVRPVAAGDHFRSAAAGNGVIAHVSEIPQKGDYLILDATPSATREKLPDCNGGSAIMGLGKIIRGGVVDGNDPYAVDLIDPVPAIAQS
jgi:hypothetical protein